MHWGWSLLDRSYSQQKREIAVLHQSQHLFILPSSHGNLTIGRNQPIDHMTTKMSGSIVIFRWLHLSAFSVSLIQCFFLLRYINGTYGDGEEKRLIIFSLFMT